MASIQDLPEEVVVMILKHLDFFSLHNFSEACQQFKRYYTDSQIVKHVEYEGNYPISNPLVSLKTFLNLNKMYITHLNLHYAYWLKKSEFLISLKKLSCLEYLNIVETGVLMEDIQNIVSTIEKLRSVSVSYEGGIFVTKSLPTHLEKIHVVLHPTKLLQFYNCIKIAEVNFLKIEFSNCQHYGNLPVTMPYFLIEIKCPELVIHNIPLMHITLKELLKRDKVINSFQYVFIETASQIYLSRDICPELEEDALVVRMESLERADLCVVKYLMSLYAVRPNCSVAAMERFVRRRYRIKRDYQIMPPTEMELQSHKAKPTIQDVMLARKLHPVEQHICEKGTYQQMIFNEDHFLTQFFGDKPGDEYSLPLKKPRVSHGAIPKLSTKCIFERALEKNRMVSSLNIVATCFKIDFTRRGYTGDLYVYNFESLNNITQLKYLKHLSMNLLPNDCHNFARLLFENCPQLESIQVTAYKFYRVEPFSEHMHLSKKMKIVLLQSSMRQIDRMLLNLSSVPTLQTVALVDLALETRPKSKISKGVLAQVVDKWKKLSYFYLYQEGIPKSWEAEYKKEEKNLKNKYKNLYVEMTKPFRINIFDKSHYNVNFPLKNNTVWH